MRDPALRTMEERLLLALSVPEGPAPPDLCREDIDWDWVLREAEFHRTLPAVGWRLRRLDPDAADAPGAPLNGIRQRGGHAYRSCLVWSTMVGQALARTARAFREKGIEIILLKGLAFAHTIYPIDALRTLSDLDILIRRRHVESARRILSQLGFRLVTAPYGERYYRERHFHFRFVGRCGTTWLSIEVHWALTPPDHFARLPLDDLERRLVPIRIEGESVRTLAPEDHLLHTCLQIDRFRAPLFRYVDAHLLITDTDSFAWDAFVKRAIRYGLRRTAASFLHELTLLFGTRIPPAATRALRPDPLLEEALAVPYRFRSDRTMGCAYTELIEFLQGDRPDRRLAFLLRLPRVLGEDRLWSNSGARGPAPLEAARVAAGMAVIAAALRLSRLARTLGLDTARPLRGLLLALWNRTFAEQEGAEQGTARE